MRRARLNNYSTRKDAHKPCTPTTERSPRIHTGVAFSSNKASASGVVCRGAGGSSAYLSASPTSMMGIPYTKPIPDSPPEPPVEKYSKNDAAVMPVPTIAAAFASEKPRISNGASPETLMPPEAH